MSKKLLLVTVLLLAVLSVYGGGQRAEEEARPGPVTISFIASAGGSGRTFTAGAERFNELYGDRYNVEVTLTAWESVLERAILQFISGRPTYDVIAVDLQWLPLVSQYLASLDSYIAQDNLDADQIFGAGMMRTMEYDGAVVALPLRIGVIVGYYRQDLFDEAGLSIPQSLEEYTNAARALTRQDNQGRVTRYGTALMAQHPTWTTWMFSQFARPQGIYYMNADFTGPSEDLRTAGTVTVLNFIKNLYDSGLTPEPLEWTYDDNIVAFQNDRLAFAAEFSQRALVLEDPKVSQAAGKMVYAPLPTGSLGSRESSHAGGAWTIAIDRNTLHHEAAFEFAKFMTANYENQKYMAMEHSNGPSIVALYDDAEYVATNPAAEAIKRVLETDGFDADFPVRQNPELSSAMHEELQAFLLGRQSAEETGRRMYSRIAEIMRN